MDEHLTGAAVMDTAVARDPDSQLERIPDHRHVADPIEVHEFGRIDQRHVGNCQHRVTGHEFADGFWLPDRVHLAPLQP